MATTASSRLVKLAGIISDSVHTLEEALSRNGIATPSFDETCPCELPEDAHAAQNAVLDATAELFDLLQDPLTLIKIHGGVSRDSACQPKPLIAFASGSIVID